MNEEVDAGICDSTKREPSVLGPANRAGMETAFMPFTTEVKEKKRKTKTHP
jgi:hypothetical protein